MTTKNEIRQWLEEGVRQGATNCIVVTDTFNYEDYPVFVMPGEDVRAKESEYRNADGSDKEMQRVMEIYDLSNALEPQLDEPRTMHY